MNISEKALLLFPIFAEYGFAVNDSGDLVNKGLTLKEIREHAQEYLGKSYSRTTLRGLIEELDNANLVVSDDSRPKRWYQLSNNSIDLEGEMSINESDISISSFTEKDLREWLNRSVESETSIQNILKNHVIDPINGKRISLLHTRCHFQQSERAV